MKCFKWLDLNEIVSKTTKEYMNFFSVILVCGLVLFILNIFVIVLYYGIALPVPQMIYDGRLLAIIPAVLTLYVFYINSCITRFHEQGRIEITKMTKAIDLINKWNEALTPDVMHARSIVDKLDRYAAATLFGKEEIVVDFDDYKVFCALTKLKMRKKNPKNKRKGKERCHCPHLDKCAAAKGIKLDRIETIWLRSLVLRYLNELEVIMQSWAVGAIDKKMIEDEFEYLVSSARDGSVVLKTFREAAGQENYPGINAFCEYISEKQKKKLKYKDISG